jgi:hypothetical protein
MLITPGGGRFLGRVGAALPGGAAKRERYRNGDPGVQVANCMPVEARRRPTRETAGVVRAPPAGQPDSCTAAARELP